MTWLRNFGVAFATFMLLASVAPVEVLSGEWWVRFIGVAALLAALPMPERKKKP